MPNHKKQVKFIQIYFMDCQHSIELRMGVLHDDGIQCDIVELLEKSQQCDIVELLEKLLWHQKPWTCKEQIWHMLLSLILVRVQHLNTREDLMHILPTKLLLCQTTPKLNQHHCKLYWKNEDVVYYKQFQNCIMPMRVFNTYFSIHTFLFEMMTGIISSK